MDITGFYAKYRKDGHGRAAYEPSIMVSLLLYADCVGQRSSRRIEQMCVRDVAFRVVAANHQPDFSTICRFRKHNEKELADPISRRARLKECMERLEKEAKEKAAAPDDVNFSV